MRINKNSYFQLSVCAVAITTVLYFVPPIALAAPPTTAPSQTSHSLTDSTVVSYHTIKVDGVDIFYREAGPKDAPVVLLLHGFPTSSHMFRNLIPKLSDKYHVIAPDYPGYGQSEAPSPDKFAYTFDHLSELMNSFTNQLKLNRYTMYVQDYGAPIGFRIASAHPEKITSIIVQNGAAYDEAINMPFWQPLKAFWADKSEANETKLRSFLDINGTKWQYTEGVRDVSKLSPDAWTLDQAYMDRPGNKDIQIALFYSYGSNPKHYPEWQSYFRKHQPPMLIVWGKNDKVFSPDGASAYKRDLPKAELHFLNTGHFALEEDGTEIAHLIRGFLNRTSNIKHP